MTFSTETPVERTSADTDVRLRELIARGFQFIHAHDEHGELVSVVGVRAHHNVIDVVQLRGEDDVVAARMPGDEQDVLAPSRVAWQTVGEASSVLDDLLGLPDELALRPTIGADDTLTPADSMRGCWVPIGPGHAKWLPAES